MARSVGRDRRDGGRHDAACASSPTSTCSRCAIRSSRPRRSRPPRRSRAIASRSASAWAGARKSSSSPGQDFKSRGKRTDEMIEVLRKLWSGAYVEHHGRFYDFGRVRMLPKPARAGADLRRRTLRARAAPRRAARRLDLGPALDAEAARDRREAARATAPRWAATHEPFDVIAASHRRLRRRRHPPARRDRRHALRHRAVDPLRRQVGLDPGQARRPAPLRRRSHLQGPRSSENPDRSRVASRRRAARSIRLARTSNEVAMKRFEGQGRTDHGRARPASGARCALRLAEEGAQLALCDVQRDGARRDREGRRASAARRARPRVVDVMRRGAGARRRAGRRRALRHASTWLCNVAGILRFDHTHELPLADWSRVLGDQPDGHLPACAARRSRTCSRRAATSSTSRRRRA